MTSRNENEFCLPDLGEGLTEAEIVAWHVSEGDHVVADQPLVTVETDKAVVDVPSPQAGWIQELEAEVGTLVQVGELLVRFASSDAAERIPDRGSVVGELSDQPVQIGSSQTRAVIKASPKARRRARELGVELTTIVGTGPDAAIGVADVENAGESGATAPLKGVRRAMAERMADAHRRVARATVTGEANVTAWYGNERPVLRLIRAIGAASRAQPLLNARFDDTAMTLTPQATVNLGIAMETDSGLFVPVLENANEANTTQVAGELERLETAVANRSIKPAQMRGQTITLSNFGAVAGLHAEMIVVPPQVSIVGAGRAFKRTSPEPGETAALWILPLSISFDHRVITGVEACEFLLSLTTDLELPS